MSGDYAALVVEAPAAGVGILTGWGNWRYFVRAATPNTTYARFDIDTFDDKNFSDGYVWTDVSSRWRGAEWTRGSDGLIDRPATGELTLTLDNNDGVLSRWNTNTTWPGGVSYLGPDLLVQVGWRDQVAGTWQPALTGLVDVAVDDQAEGDADRWMTWQIVETTSLLAIIDRAEQPSVGAADDVFDRIDRLLDEAQWQFGTGANFGGGFINPTLQPTTLAGNRLGELYLTADTGFLDAFSDRYGRLDTWAKGFTDPFTLADGTTRRPRRRWPGATPRRRHHPGRCERVPVDTDAVRQRRPAHPMGPRPADRRHQDRHVQPGVRRPGRRHRVRRRGQLECRPQRAVRLLPF